MYIHLNIPLRTRMRHNVSVVFNAPSASAKKKKKLFTGGKSPPSVAHHVQTLLIVAGAVVGIPILGLATHAIEGNLSVAM